MICRVFVVGMSIIAPPIFLQEIQSCGNRAREHQASACITNSTSGYDMSELHPLQASKICRPVVTSYLQNAHI